MQRVGPLTAYDDSPTYGCTLFAPGTKSGVSAAIVSSLGRQGFETVCGEDERHRTEEIWGVRGELRALARVSEQRGRVQILSDGAPGDIHRAGYRPSREHAAAFEFRDAPAGQVIVRLAASDRERRQGLPEGPQWRPCERQP